MKRSPRWAVLTAAWIVLMAELILPQSASAMRIRLPDLAPYPVDDIGEPDGPSGGRMSRAPAPDQIIAVVPTPFGFYLVQIRSKVVTGRLRATVRRMTPRER